MDTCNAHKCGEPGDRAYDVCNRECSIEVVRERKTATSRERPDGIHPIRYSRVDDRRQR